jgi:hypothetical protein
MTGVAMAGRYLGQRCVAMTWIGDGGSSTGAFHEGLNLAAVQHAPFVLILENNQWAYSTPVARQVPVKNLADRALAYGIRSRTVDGNDVLAVYRATKQSVDECRAGSGPVLIEVKTMRMKGHAQHDGAEYVPAAMLDYWKARDPIARFEKYLTENNLWDAEKKSAIDARIDSELETEQKFAEDSPMPPPELAEQGVYCEGCHTVEAEWHRPKEELMPPASSAEPVWKVKDFGALVAAAANSNFKSKEIGSSVNNRVRTSAPGVNPPSKVAARPFARTGGREPAERDVSAETPLRVPFGRGPVKGKPVVDQHPRHKRGKH